jgi:hypothetical protein
MDSDAHRGEVASNGDNGVKMVTGVVEGSLVEMYIFFSHYQQRRCNLRLQTLVSSKSRTVR